MPCCTNDVLGELYQSNIKGNDCNVDAVQNCSQSYSNVNLGNDVHVYQTSDAEGADETEDDDDILHYCHSSDLNYRTEPTFSELEYSLPRFPYDRSRGRRIATSHRPDI